MSQKPDWIITAAELAQCLGKVTLVDVREPEENEESKIETSVLIPLGEISSRAEAELKKDDEIVLYCAHGVRSLEAMMGLRMLGFQKLRSLEGGICAWEEQGFGNKSGNK